MGGDVGRDVGGDVGEDVGGQILAEILAENLALFGVDLSPTISKANFQNMQVI